MGLGALLFGDYKKLAEQWDTAVANVATPTAKESADLFIGALEKQLDRASSALSANETKAALVIPAIGGIAGLTGVKLNTERLDNPLFVVLSGLIVLFGVVAVVLATLALSPRSRSNGPQPVKVVPAINLDECKARLEYIKALGFAAYSTEQANNSKAFYLNWSLRFVAIAVLLIVVLAGAGGLETPTQGGE